MNILIYGIGGTMGSVVYSRLKEEADLTACCGVDKFLSGKEDSRFDIPIYANCQQVTENIDCIIDFSNHSCVYDYIPYATKNAIPCVVATTGFDSKEQSLIDEASKIIPIFQTGNMSLGINIIEQLIKVATTLVGNKSDIEIIEMHHNRKIDAPSGTAKMLANAIKEISPNKKLVYGREGITGKRNQDEIGIHSIRGGSLVGKHDVLFILNDEVITISHESQDKTIFASGSIDAARFILTKKNGIYNMQDLLNSQAT